MRAHTLPIRPAHKGNGSHQVTFSVVINTYNRARYLQDCLVSLSQQTYPDFEVIVVDGPSTDHTGHILSQWGARIKAFQTKHRNLAVSRNIGIDACQGDVVAFIDDDAVAYPNWLSALAQTYRDNWSDTNFAGCGGFVLDHTGRKYQSQYLMCNRLGQNSNRIIDLQEFFSYPNSFWIPYNMGTNCSFRLSHLKEVGGFDEEYAWFYDETDVAQRLTDFGFHLTTNPKAVVLHRYAPSHLRDPERIPRTSFVTARSFAYFVMRNLPAHLDTRTAGIAIEEYQQNNQRYWDGLLKDKKISNKHHLKLSEEQKRGIEEGTADSFEPRKLGQFIAKDSNLESLAMEAASLIPTSFRQPNVRAKTIVIATTEYPPIGMGIAKLMSTLAQGFVFSGYTVRVLNIAAYSAIEWQEGVFVHQCTIEGTPITYKNPMPNPYLVRASEIFKREIKQIEATEKICAIISHVWDCPVATFLEDPRVLLYVQTLHLITDGAYKFSGKPNSVKHLSIEQADMCRFEKYLFSKHHERMVYNSRFTASSCAKLFKLSRPPKSKKVIPHGIDVLKFSQTKRAHVMHTELRILYVGRLERRKGIDTLFRALSRLQKNAANFSVVMIGKDQGELESTGSYETQLAKKFPKLARQESFKGHLPHEEVEAYLQSTDIFVSPSLYESFGFTLVEAMARKLCVVSSRTGIAEEAIEHGTNGFLFPPGDDEALSKILLGICKNRAVITNCAAKALVIVQERYRSHHMINNLIGLIEENVKPTTH